MNKKNNRKGFTTVELVIVIAVIAILASVLIPTFANLIDKANKSAALQEAKNIYNNYMIDQAENAESNGIVIKVTKPDGDYYFKVQNGALVKEPIDAANVPDNATIIISKATTDTDLAGWQIASEPSEPDDDNTP